MISIINPNNCDFVLEVFKKDVQSVVTYFNCSWAWSQFANITMLCTLRFAVLAFLCFFYGYDYILYSLAVVSLLK